MIAKWRKINCSSCDAVFSINVEWVKPPDICQLCRLKREDLVDVLEVLIRAPSPDVTQLQKIELGQILESSIYEVELILIDRAIFIFGEFGVAVTKNDVCLGMGSKEIQRLIHRTNRVSEVSAQKISRSENELVWTIFYILNTHGDNRRRMLNDHIALKLRQYRNLSKIILRAARIYRNLSKYDSKIRKRNDQRELLVFGGKRRWG